MKVVFDTNILISTLLVKVGTQAKLLRFSQKGTYQILLSQDIFTELNRVLHYPRIRKAFPLLTEADIKKYMIELKVLGLMVKKLPHLAVIKQDPKDDHILACAVAGKADYIVTGDRHLLDLNIFRNISILTPVNFLKKVLNVSNI